MEDSQIIGMYFERDEKAIHETDIKYRKLCYGIAYNILHNSEDAAEALNDTYLNLWNSIPPQRPNVFSAFIGRITRNISLKKLRSKKTAKRGGGEIEIVFDEIADCIRSEQDVEREIEANELSKIVNNFVYSLSETERNVFICRYWYFDSVRNISSQFGFSESKVKSMLLRIRGKLRKKLKEENLI